MSTTFLTVEELADRHRTSTHAVHMRRHRGDGPRAHKIGKRVLFALTDVEAWEIGCAEGPAPAEADARS